MDDDRLKAAGGGLYFDELLARIRDIRKHMPRWRERKERLDNMAETLLNS